MMRDAMTSAAPLFCSAMAIPNAAAIAMSTVQSTERRACSPVRQRVSSIKPAAPSDAVIRFMLPVAFTSTIKKSTTAASHARSWRGGALSSTSAMSAKFGSRCRALGEIGVRLDEQHIPRLKPNVADFGFGHAHALPMDRENRGVVNRAKSALPHGLPDERRMGADDGLDQHPVAPRRDFVDLVGVGDDALLSQVDHRIDDPGEVQPVAFAQHRRRRNRGEHAPRALDFVEVHAPKRTQARLLDAFADDRRALLDAHRNGVLARLPELLQRAAPVFEQPLRGRRR